MVRLRAPETCTELSTLPRQCSIPAAISARPASRESCARLRWVATSSRRLRSRAATWPRSSRVRPLNRSSRGPLAFRRNRSRCRRALVMVLTDAARLPIVSGARRRRGRSDRRRRPAGRCAGATEWAVPSVDPPVEPLCAGDGADGDGLAGTSGGVQRHGELHVLRSRAMEEPALRVMTMWLIVRSPLSLSVQGATASSRSSARSVATTSKRPGYGATGTGASRVKVVA